MKTIPPVCPEPETGPKYWRSLDQLADTPEFRSWAEREFPAGASELTDPSTRRHFVKLMSASFLLAGFGLTGCRRPVENIYPFQKMPEGYVHGMARFFATAMPTRGTAIPLVAKSHDGRPVKLEGNDKHPDSNGATDRYAQAAILNLYDPDRATRFLQNGTTKTAEDALVALRDLSKALAATGGKGLAILSEQTASPSRERIEKAIAAKLPQAKWYRHEAVDFDIHRQAATAATGKPVTPYFKIDEAKKVVVALDCDFIGAEENAHINIRRFAKGRRVTAPGQAMSRLYAIEPLMTLTGANADHRLRMPATGVSVMAGLLAEAVLTPAGGDAKLVAAVKALVDAKAVAALSEQVRAGDAKFLNKWATECAKDLLAAKGESLVLAGQRQPLAVHLAAYAINAALGNLGKTVIFLDAPAPSAGAIAELAQALTGGQVETLVVLGGNPAYDAPADLKWEAAQAKAKTVVRLGYYEDETTPANGWQLPQAHFLESWGDARTSDGTLVAVQPLIEPLFGGLTELEVLARIGGLDKITAYEIVRETFGTDEEKWKKFLHDGFLADSAAAPVSVALATDAVAAGLAAAPAVTVPAKDKLEVVFHRDYKADDGRFNNNGWMQELPDPITKMTWENTILISQKTATDLGLVVINRENNQLMVPWVKITVNGMEVEGPLWTQPGQADNVIGLALGYGRRKTGRVGLNSGYNAYSVRTTKALHFTTGATLKNSGEKHHLATTQDHWSMEGRPIIREGTHAEFQKHPRFAKAFDMETPPGMEDGENLKSLYPNPLDEVRKTALHQWGMSIDLSACVGCSTCMVACQSENNIPIVGKYQVANNREMHWIRIDRYFTGKVEDPQVVNQPMLCQHCEAAPCENVCPVNATSHDQEGLNVMTYNRCVGTRYCSNNCPYKVRRFNYFDYNRRTLEQLKGPVYTTPLLHKTDGELDVMRWWRNPDLGTRPADEWELLKLVKNPEVTVRMRGVMEKCTYCLQRIEGAKIAQKVKARDTGDVTVPDGTIKTACQQACPAEAIVFGNVADPKSAVSILKKQQRNYSVLDFLNTKPRTTYLARLRNPNPAMPDKYDAPFSTEEYEAKNGKLEEESGNEAHAHAEHAGKKGAE